MDSKYMLYIFIIFLVFFILLTLAIVGMFFYLVFMNSDKKKENTGEKIDSIVSEIKSGFTKLEDVRKGNFCKLHPGVKSTGKCAVCDELFCEDCIMEMDKVNLCPEHFRLVNENEWAVVDSVKTDSQSPEKSMYIYDFKKKMWEESMIPMYVVTHYQINISSDEIVSQVDLFSKRNEQFSIGSDLSKFKNDYFEKLDAQKNDLPTT